ncbi:helix-turn-helix domain-containing protein [Occallatibacter riparius]|uniref:Helix-turn-helix transcriptional regulator n=1 Tax=Occallatibacter riparius TaxID=1002689 RepID=A0A9J7BPN2_9BACT|nr:helix-turn-helix transcriptional regulator [Occallatibacter riparius]UWZ84664.1 helix-turn-helix transcriptional regulator [Occallatibacter riparius]
MADMKDDLTPRQAEIVVLLCRGFEYKEIAAELGISHQVVRNYMANAVRRSGARTATQLAVWVALARERNKKS